MFGHFQLDLGLDAFVDWLCERSAVSVGLLGSWLCSPLAVWLSDVCGSACWVDAESYGLVVSFQWVPLPGWACLFLVWTERYGGFLEVTGAQVFEVLACLELGGSYGSLSA